MIILDTHALIWLDEGNPRLGQRALEQIDDALKDSRLYISTISYWEAAMLNVKKTYRNNYSCRYLTEKSS